MLYSERFYLRHNGGTVVGGTLLVNATSVPPAFVALVVHPGGLHLTGGEHVSADATAQSDLTLHVTESPYCFNGTVLVVGRSDRTGVVWRRDRTGVVWRN